LGGVGNLRDYAGKMGATKRAYEDLVMYGDESGNRKQDNFEREILT